MSTQPKIHKCEYRAWSPQTPNISLSQVCIYLSKCKIPAIVTDMPATSVLHLDNLTDPGLLFDCRRYVRMLLSVPSSSNL